MSTQEIYSGHSHSFDTGIALHLGVTAAIVYNHIFYWLQLNAKKKDAQLIEDKYWMYETQQEMADFLGYVTLEEVKKSIVKLLAAGLLIKGNFNKNPFDRTAWYTIPDQNKIKKILTKAPYGAIDSAINPNRESHTAPSDSAIRRHPTSHTAPSIIHNNNQEKDQYKKPATGEAAAAFPKKPNQEPRPVESIIPKPPPKPRAYACLEPIQIPEPDKIEITQRYSEECVKNAIAWAMHPETKLSKGLSPAIKWACQNKPNVPKFANDISSENKAYANQFAGRENAYARVDVLHDQVEIIYKGCQKVPLGINYTDKGFKPQLENALRKCNLWLK